MTRFIQLSLLIATVTAASTISLGSNKTPGDDIGPDHTGYAFNAYSWSGMRGHSDFAKHVGSGGPTSGQQYSISQYIQGSAGLTVPNPCTVANFYQIIRSNETNLAALLLISHGGNNTASIEPFEKTPAGMAARDARYAAYLNGTVPGCPAFTASEIYQSANHDAWAVGITNTFIQNYGKMNESLSYVATCNGDTLVDDFVAAGGRVSVGYTGSVFYSDLAKGIKQFFSKMDGQEGIDKRPVAKAMLGLAHPLGSSGNTATTLAPAVKTLEAPCPIAVGDKVTYTLDTECEQILPGDIVGTNVTIENEVWLSKTQLQGTCTAVANDGTIYTLRLKFDNVWSDQNIARLDGNTRPFLINARGPAHDDHLTWKYCPVFCLADITGDSVVDVSDLLTLLDSWGSDNAVADIDGSGTVDIADLLLMLGSWGVPCESGACCVDNYCLEDVSTHECENLGGDYLGDDSTCEDPYACAKVGACCFAPYECYDYVFEDDCLTWGGTFEGEDSTCESSTCWFEPTGACCYDNESCLEDVAANVCESSGGYFLGIDTGCFEDNCPYFDPGGACCIESSDGTECIDFTTEEDCYFLGGDYRGPGTLCDSVVCAPIGACCVVVGSTPSCYDAVTQDLCDDGSWYEGETCEDINWECTPPWGACCLLDMNACLDGFSEIECDQENGVFYLETTCSDVVCEGTIGACCVGPDCYVMTAWQCGELDGYYLGDSTDCSGTPCQEPPGTGACCIYDGMGNGSCTLTTETDCYEVGGQYYGDGTECNDLLCDVIPVGACCFTNGDCMDSMDLNECKAMGGIFHSDADCSGTSCLPATGACCWSDGTCSDSVYPEDCAYSGGTFYGTTTCLNAPCEPQAGCADGEIEDCNGNCYPASWVGDTICDDGTWGAVFNCPEFNCDGGDCPPENCDG